MSTSVMVCMALRTSAVAIRVFSATSYVNLFDLINTSSRSAFPIDHFAYASFSQWRDARTELLTHSISFIAIPRMMRTSAVILVIAQSVHSCTDLKASENFFYLFPKDVDECVRTSVAA